MTQITPNLLIFTTLMLVYMAILGVLIKKARRSQTLAMGITRFQPLRTTMVPYVFKRAAHLVRDLQAQNSCAERTWQTLTNTTLRLLQDAQLPAKYYEGAMATAAWVKNRIYSTAVDGMTPHEAMWSEKPDLSLLRVWGSPAYMHIPKHKVVKPNNGVATRRRKLDSKVRPAFFVGYADNFKAWRFYDHVVNK